MKHPPFSDGFPTIFRWFLHHFQMVSPFQKHQKSLHESANSISTSPSGVSCRWVTGQVLREDILVSLCARPVFAGPYGVLTLGGKPWKTPRIWPGGPLVLKHALLENAPLISIDNFPALEALDLRIYIPLPCLITGGYSQSIFPRLKHQTKKYDFLMRSS